MNPHLIFQVGQNPPRGVQIPKKPPIQTYIIFAVMSKLIKRKENFPHTEYKEIQNGAVAKSYKTNGLLIYGKYLRISSYIRKPFLI